MSSGESTALDYVIDYVYIENESLKEPMNIGSLISEINIYEHIDKQYLTASLMFTDNNNIVSDLNISGSEKVRIRITVDMSENADPNFSIEKMFVIHEITQSVKSSDYAETVMLQLVEEAAYLSRVKRVSKSYTNHPHKIIQSIAREYLEKEIKLISEDEEYVESKRLKVIVPNLDPLDAMNWIKDRAATRNGMPYFLFASLCDNQLRYIDLETILSAPPLNAKEYIYSQTFGGDLDKYDVNTQSYVIHSYKTTNKENQLDLSRMGLVGAKYNFFDTTTGNNKEQDFDISKIFDGLLDRGSIKNNQGNYIYDAKSIIGDRKLHQHSSTEISQIVTTNIYQDNNYNYYEASSGKMHMLKPTSKAMRNFLHKASVDIGVAGKNFFYANTNKTLGNIISINFKNTREQNFNDDHRDNKRSGEFLIYAVRHTFTADKYRATLTCAKLAHEKGPQI